MRHVALTLVSQLFECMEMLGTIPQQLRYVLVVLVPKATTGPRPIGIFCALYRLWAKCRTAMAQTWENLNPRSYFAASKGRAVTDPIWRDAAAVKCGVDQGEKVRKQSQFGGILHSWVNEGSPLEKRGGCRSFGARQCNVWRWLQGETHLFGRLRA